MKGRCELILSKMPHLGEGPFCIWPFAYKIRRTVTL